MTFDLEGVRAVLKETRHLNSFREEITKPGVAKYIKLEQQKRVAQQIVGHAEHYDVELTVNFIKRWVYELAKTPKAIERRLAEDERIKREKANPQYQLDRLLKSFNDRLRSFINGGDNLREFLVEHKQVTFNFPPDFFDKLDEAKKLINGLHAKVTKYENPRQKRLGTFEQ